MKHASEYRDAGISREILGSIHRRARSVGRPLRIMEVCGTHTVSIFKSGIRSLLPEHMELLSGPGCPVCVTSQADIDTLCAVAETSGTITGTFGDMIRVPGTTSSLGAVKADGGDVRVVYSAMDAVAIAAENPGKRLVFAGIGFETTAPTIAASILAANRMGTANYMVLSCHKRVYPAVEALVNMKGPRVDAFLLPGHVSVITGEAEYAPLAEKYGIPCAIAGFEPADILAGILAVTEQAASGLPRLANCYPRSVRPAGNPRARQIMSEVFENADSDWRGIGPIPGSGLKIRRKYRQFDAAAHFGIPLPHTVSPSASGCACGRILTGRLTPPECPLYGKSCTPATPVGPCMVSGEGTCAAYYKYRR